jgi:Carboxypeptidase regulatory-like domain/TonB dependent receptor-like, beta-barrel
MRRRLFCSVVAAWAFLALAGVSYGQGGTTQTLSGVVVDSGGGVVPGANVVVKHTGTGVSDSSVTNAEGSFSFPGLQIGTYTVTITLDGFKTFIANNVVLTAGTGANVKATLEVGGVSEQVVVSSASEIVQTQSSTVSSTINTNQISKLPVTSRSAMDFIPFLPGVSTPGGNRDSTINGLPKGVINITLDGVNIQDNTLRTSDGFFAIVSPRLDAIEEVTVTTASQGADGAGQGAVQIKFTTRAGTNQFIGSGYEYYRSDKLNASTWFNNRDNVAKAKLKQNQYGVRYGGPVVIPGLYDGRNKAFFFVNYEEQKQPSDTTRNRTVLNPQAQQGLFSYTANGVTNTVNVLGLAGANGQVATADPVIANILNDIRNATGKTGSLAPLDVNLQTYTFNVPVESVRRYPTTRVDYNVNDSHRASFSYNYQKFTDYPDTLNNRDNTFPGFPVAAGQSSVRKEWSGQVRSTLTRNLVNEARAGHSGAPVQFFAELNTGMFTGSTVFQQGFNIGFPSVRSNLTGPNPGLAPQSRNATATVYGDTLTWLKGSHNITMGGEYTQYDIWLKNSNLVPSVAFGLDSTDPAQGLFTTANFPGAAQADLTAAGNLYALLTGRVTDLNYDARIDEATGQYVAMGTGTQRGRMRETGFYAQDAWRIKPNLTINAGIRYDVQFPFTSKNDSYSMATFADVCGVSGLNADGTCNLFQAGNQPGIHPTFQQFKAGTNAYNTDGNNIAPSIGATWTPGERSGVLGKMFGKDGDTVFRGGYTRSFSRNGLNDLTGPYNSNPGITIGTPRRQTTIGNLYVNGATAPLLFRNTGALGPGSFPSTPVYPMTDVVTQDVSILDPNLQVPYADSYTVGIQRAVSRNMALEVRYVGTRSRDNWLQLNYNEFNVFENGFINEFKNAQANLQANIAAGRGNTFAFTGAPGTVPLPVFAGFYNGLNSSNAQNAALYTGTSWTNTNFINFLAARNPNPYGFASANANGLMGSATNRSNAAAAGIPFNYFVANPDLLGGANVTSNVDKTDYNSLQVELRRRLSQGLQFNTSYVFGNAQVSNFFTFRRPLVMGRDTGTPGDLTHALKANVVYDLPFGRGRRFAGNANGTLDRIVGGWQLGVNVFVNSGRLIDFGNVRLVGMTEADVQGMFKLRFDNANKFVYMLPQDVIDQTINAFNVSATSPTGYSGAAPTGKYFAPANGPDCIEPDPGRNFGECGVRELVVHGPVFSQTDISIRKRTQIVGRANFEFAAEMLNAFNHPNFVPVGGLGATLANYRVTGLTGTNTARVVQLVMRVNW